MVEASAPTLAISTSTAACSVALFGDDGAVLGAAHDVVGRGHAEKLVSMIAGLPGGGRAGTILVDCGPGSFTGIRVGLAAALGLGFGWGSAVHGFGTLALVAAMAFAQEPGLEELVVVMEGGHGELFVQPFASPLEPLAPFASLTPQAVRAMLNGRAARGNGLARLMADLPMGTEAADLPLLLPDAAMVRLLPKAMTALPARPIYGRAPDAKLPAAAALASQAAAIQG